MDNQMIAKINRRAVCKMTRSLFALCCLLTYALPVLAASDKPVPDGQKSYKEFRATIKSFPYSASAERKKQIVENYLSLRVGMTKKQVAGSIGNPDYSELMFGPKGPGEHWLGSHWMYALFVREDAVNEKDPKIQIFFDTDGLVSWVVPSGISGLTEIGDCCKRSR